MMKGLFEAKAMKELVLLHPQRLSSFPPSSPTAPKA